MKPLPHPLCKAGSEQAQNPCNHLMNEGVTDRKYGTASKEVQPSSACD